MGDVKKLPVCKFGSKCYRKNKAHLESFSHPHRQTRQSDGEGEPSKKKAKIDDFFNAGNEKPGENSATSGIVSQVGEEVVSTDKGKNTASDNVEKNTEDDAHSVVTHIGTTPDVREDVKSKFLVEMPEDFFQFWDFAKSLHPKNPQDAFKGCLGLVLVGPYDVVAGRQPRDISTPVSYLTHYRYCFDPPEFLTVVKGCDKSQFHFGYYRDDPAEMPVFVASNSAAENSTLTPRGENIFAAVSWFIDERLKEGKSTNLKELKDKLLEWAIRHHLSVLQKTAAMKARDKKVVSKTFHGAGIVVPVDRTGVGYRPLPETPGSLKKILKKIVESQDETERNVNLDPLTEIVMLVQFANDECDYGEGLELGLDLFSFTLDDCFHKLILSLAPLAYQFLNRGAFGEILKAHLAHRKLTGNLSVLD